MNHFERRVVFGADFAAVQAKLNSLGANPQLSVDGQNGPMTTAAVKAFQNAKGLVPDGVVGPMTLAALGLSGSATSTPVPTGTASVAPVNANTAAAIQKAWQTAQNASPTMPAQQKQYVVSVALGEGFFGNGWNNPSAEATAHGLTGTEGVGSHNWGAIQGVGSAGSFPHIDHHADGTAYVGQFKKYLTDEEGFLDMAKLILGGGPIRKAVGAAAIQGALAKGNLHDAVYAQHDDKYFELAPDKYLATVIRNYNTIGSVVGWQKLLGPTGVAIATGVGGGLIALIVGVIGFVLIKRFA